MGDLEDVGHRDRPVFPVLDGQIDVPPGRLGALVEVTCTVLSGSWLNDVEREVGLGLGVNRPQPAAGRVVIASEDSVAGAGAQVEHQAGRPTRRGARRRPSR